MSDEQRPTVRTVRVRRSPKITLFLALGAVVGAFVALVGTLSVPTDPRYPVPQVLGFLVLLLAPLGALVGGAIAIVIDRALGRTAREVQAEYESTAPPEEPDPETPEEL